MKLNKLRHEFVESFPDRLAEGVLYVSIPFATTAHSCACGCGQPVISPITPTDWKLIYDGDTVSLHPSIGNWSFPCRSHYFVTRDEVRWAGDMSDEDIAAVRAADRRAKAGYYEEPEATPVMRPTLPAKRSLGARISRLLKSLFR